MRVRFAPFCVHRRGRYLRLVEEVLIDISEKSPKILQRDMSTQSKHLYEFGPFRLDTGERLLLRGGEPVPLTPKTFETLVALVERSGHLVEKDELMKLVWSEAYVEESNLTNNVYALRKMLGQTENGRSYIETVPKRGYRFTAAVKELPPEVVVVEKRTLTRVVTEESLEDDLPKQSMSGASEALGKAHARIQTPQSSKWRWPAIALMSASLAIGVFFMYRSLTAAPRGQIDSIAVLPFRNESGDPDIEYLSDGMTESLINRLSQLSQLKVIARNSTFEYKGKNISPQDVSHALGVQAILLGHVRQRDDSLIVSVELMDVRDKTQVWGERYTRKATDIQALQEDITRAIVEKLLVKLNGAQEQQLTKRATQNPAAYQLYLSGLFYVRKMGLENTRKALDYFNQAVALDPNFALAWVGLARAHESFAGDSLIEPQEALAKAKAAVHKALELDETLADAHAALGRVKKNEWDWTGAEREFKRAIELNPNLPEARFRYSDFLSLMGRHTEALAEIKRAHELDPLADDLGTREAWTLLLARRYDEALEKYQNALKLNPNSAAAHNGLGFTYIGIGMYEQAVEEFQKGMSITGDMRNMQCYLGYALAKSGKRSEANAILDKLKATSEYVSPTELAELYVALGNKEAAFASLERAYAAHDLQLSTLKVSLTFDSLRTDARFQDLMRRVGLM